MKAEVERTEERHKVRKEVKMTVMTRVVSELSCNKKSILFCLMLLYISVYFSCFTVFALISSVYQSMLISSAISFITTCCAFLLLVFLVTYTNL